jgi:hypothetical protein
MIDTVYLHHVEMAVLGFRTAGARVDTVSDAPRERTGSWLAEPTAEEAQAIREAEVLWAQRREELERAILKAASHSTTVEVEGDSIW